MAIDYSGLFATPESIKLKRINALEGQAAQQRMMGGSMAGLLGQVAAGRGGMLAEATAGAFGLQTVEEKEAEQTQGVISGIDWNDPESVMAASQKLSEMGLSQSALQVGEKGQQLEAVKRQEEAHAMNMKVQDTNWQQAKLTLSETKKRLENNPRAAEILAMPMNTPEQRAAALEKAAKLGDPQLVKDIRAHLIAQDNATRMAAANQGMSFGTTQTVKDSAGNLFSVVQARPKDGIGDPKQIITALDGSDTQPVGALEVVSGSTGLTASESIEVAGAKTGATETAKDWASIRQEARTSVVDGRSTMKRVDATVAVVERIATGGWDEAASRMVDEATGKTPADIGDAQFLLEENVLSQLKQTFGAQFTEKEGQWLRSVMPNIDDSPEAIKAKLARIRKFAEDKMKQGQAILKMKNIGEYDEWLVGNDGDATLDYVDKELSETEQGNTQAPAAAAVEQQIATLQGLLEELKQL